jgi:hypothetical protein
MRAINEEKMPLILRKIVRDVSWGNRLQIKIIHLTKGYKLEAEGYLSHVEKGSEDQMIRPFSNRAEV